MRSFHAGRRGSVVLWYFLSSSGDHGKVLFSLGLCLAFRVDLACTVMWSEKWSLSKVSNSSITRVIESAMSLDAKTRSRFP